MGVSGYLWVLGRSCLQERPLLSVCPITLQQCQSLFVVSMQMDAHYKEEQIGTLHVWVEALEGG